MLWGWSMMRGLISEPVMDGVNRIVRLSIITAAALNLGIYNAYLGDLLWHSPDALASYVASGNSSSLSNAQFLDQLMSQMFDLGHAYWHTAMAKNPTSPIPDMGMLALAFLVWLGGIISTAYGAFLLALSKIALAILLGVGPLFVLMTLFEPTKRFFDAWIGQALNYVFLVMLTAAAVKLMMSIMAKYLAAATDAGVLAEPNANQAFPAIALSIISFLVLTQIPSIASALGGGVAVGTMGAVRWGFSKIPGGVNAARPTSLRRSIARAKDDYAVAKNTVKAIGGMPTAVFRKISGKS
jgi:type IV secretion system protein VirB6